MKKYQPIFQNVYFWKWDGDVWDGLKMQTNFYSVNCNGRGLLEDLRRLKDDIKMDIK
jgi:hypothetical protein